MFGQHQEDGQPSRAPRGREAEHLLVAELLQEIRTLRETSSAHAQSLLGAVVNEVLVVETTKFDADGVVSRQYRTMVGSVVVANIGTADVSVSSSPPASGIGATGVGQYVVRKDTAVSVPIGSRTVTIYGTAGDTVGLQVYAGRVPPMSGPC